MNEALSIATPAAPRISLTQRFIIYGLVWLLAVVAFELWLRPWTPTESHLTEAEQRVRWPFYTPLMVAFGIATIIASSPQIPVAISLLVIALLLAHAVFMLTRSSRRAFVALTTIQVIVFAVAVSNVIRMSYLSDGP